MNMKRILFGLGMAGILAGCGDDGKKENAHTVWQADELPPCIVEAGNDLMPELRAGARSNRPAGWDGYQQAKFYNFCDSTVKIVVSGNAEGASPTVLRYPFSEIRGNEREEFGLAQDKYKQQMRLQ